jgi:hypothetical protein
MIELNSFKKNISEEDVKKIFFYFEDPFDFAMAITKELE